MFHDFIVLPILNLLIFIYAIIPGHNFGVALILFTILVRLLMWPLVKKQLRQAKITRALQPELKRIKQETKGDKQKQSMMMMELYKERGVNPFGTIPTLIVQMVVLIGLYIGLTAVIKDPKQLVDMAYPFIQNLPWMKELAANPALFDSTFLGFIDLWKPALSESGIYIPAFLLVLGSAGIQFLTSRQLMPVDKDARKLRDILKGAGDGQQADQAEVSAAVSKNMQYIIPVMVFIFTINLAAALSLYWFVGGLVAYIQQYIALREEGEDLEKVADKATPKSKATKKKLANAKKAVIVAEPTTTPVAAATDTATKTTKSGSKVSYSTGTSTPTRNEPTQHKKPSKSSKKANKKRRR
ncbi:MAG: YidC/Oxa1 family membrane protein insertase [Candidatus Saccharimonadales bacterium]